MIYRRGREWSRSLMAVAILASAAIVQPAWAGPAEDGVSAAARGDFDLARRLWIPAAKNGDAQAAFLLGDMYEHGRSVAVDRTEAARWYFLAAEKGDAIAKGRLAAISDDAFAATIGPPKGEATVGSDEAQAPRDKDLAASQARDRRIARFNDNVAQAPARFEAYKACSVRAAKRLEVSNERSDLVVQAALHYCAPAREALRGGGDVDSQMPGLSMNDYDAEARADAMLAVIEARAKRTTAPIARTK
jgi:hypothetical protein